LINPVYGDSSVPIRIYVHIGVMRYRIPQTAVKMRFVLIKSGLENALSSPYAVAL